MNEQKIKSYEELSNELFKRSMTTDNVKTSNLLLRASSAIQELIREVSK